MKLDNLVFSILTLFSGSAASVFRVQNMNLRLYHSVNVEIQSIDPPLGEGYEGGHQVVITGVNLVPGLGVVLLSIC